MDNFRYLKIYAFRLNLIKRSRRDTTWENDRSCLYSGWKHSVHNGIAVLETHTSSLSAINYEKVQRSEKKMTADKSWMHSATKHFNLFSAVAAFADIRRMWSTEVWSIYSGLEDTLRTNPDGAFFYHFLFKHILVYDYSAKLRVSPQWDSVGIITPYIYYNWYKTLNQN